MNSGLRALFEAAAQPVFSQPGDLSWGALADPLWPPLEAGVFEVSLLNPVETIAHALFYRSPLQWDFSGVVPPGWAENQRILQACQTTLRHDIVAVWIEIEGQPSVAFPYLSLGTAGIPGLPLSQASACLMRCCEVLGVSPPLFLLASAPPHARLLHLAALAHRRPGQIRLSLSLPLLDLMAWLEALAWEGDRQLLFRVALGLTGLKDPVFIQMDILQGRVGPAISVERTRPGRAPDWEAIGTFIQHFGVAPQHWAQVFAWPGQDAAFVRTLEVKLRVCEDKVDAVKAYLLFENHPVHKSLPSAPGT